MPPVWHVARARCVILWVAVFPEGAPVDEPEDLKEYEELDSAFYYPEDADDDGCG
jgi:hypothetical protein